MKAAKTLNKMDPLHGIDGKDLTDKAMGSVLPKTPKVDTSGTEKAQQAIIDAQNAANSLQKNFATDLGVDNLTTVQAGASANASGDAMTDMVKRKRPGASGLSSALGIGG